jgi:hypothetical protein
LCTAADAAKPRGVAALPTALTLPGLTGPARRNALHTALAADDVRRVKALLALPLALMHGRDERLADGKSVTEGARLRWPTVVSGWLQTACLESQSFETLLLLLRVIPPSDLPSPLPQEEMATALLSAAKADRTDVVKVLAAYESASMSTVFIDRLTFWTDAAAFRVLVAAARIDMGRRRFGERDVSAQESADGVPYASIELTVMNVTPVLCAMFHGACRATLEALAPHALPAAFCTAALLLHPKQPDPEDGTGVLMVSPAELARLMERDWSSRSRSAACASMLHLLQSRHNRALRLPETRYGVSRPPTHYAGAFWRCSEYLGEVDGFRWGWYDQGCGYYAWPADAQRTQLEAALQTQQAAGMQEDQDASLRAAAEMTAQRAHETALQAQRAAAVAAAAATAQQVAAAAAAERAAADEVARREASAAAAQRVAVAAAAQHEAATALLQITGQVRQRVMERALSADDTQTVQALLAQPLALMYSQIGRKNWSATLNGWLQTACARSPTNFATLLVLLRALPSSELPPPPREYLRLPLLRAAEADRAGALACVSDNAWCVCAAAEMVCCMLAAALQMWCSCSQRWSRQCCRSCSCRSTTSGRARLRSWRCWRMPAWMLLRRSSGRRW